MSKQKFLMRAGRGSAARHPQDLARLNLIAGNLRNVRDIFRIGLEHRLGGRLS